MNKKRMSRARKFSNCVIPEIEEIGGDLENFQDDNNLVDDTSSKNNRSDQTSTLTEGKTESKKRRQSTGWSKENDHKVQDIIEGTTIKITPN